jgi:hypothetical protein
MIRGMIPSQPDPGRFRGPVLQFQEKNANDLPLILVAGEENIPDRGEACPS